MKNGILNDAGLYGIGHVSFSATPMAAGEVCEGFRRFLEETYRGMFRFHESGDSDAYYRIPSEAVAYILRVIFSDLFGRGVADIYMDRDKRGLSVTWHLPPTCALSADTLHDVRRMATQSGLSIDNRRRGDVFELRLYFPMTEPYEKLYATTARPTFYEVLCRVCIGEKREDRYESEGK